MMTVKQHIKSAIRKAGYRLDQVFMIAQPETISALRKSGELPRVRTLEVYWVPGMSIADIGAHASVHIMDLRNLWVYASPRRRRIITAVYQGRI